MRNGSRKSVLSLGICSLLVAILCMMSNIFVGTTISTAYAAEVITGNLREDTSSDYYDYTVEYTDIEGQDRIPATLVGFDSENRHSTITISDEFSVTIGDVSKTIYIDTIGATAFVNKTNLVSITLPSTVTTIMDGGAFMGCDSLQSVVAPNLESIGSYAFYACTSLETVNAPKLNIVAGYGFYGCTSLSSITTSSIVSIGERSFENNSSLVSFVADEITTIGDSAFSGCATLSDVRLGKVTSIDESMFANCMAIETFEAVALESIGNNVFKDRYSITTVNTPNLEAIGDNAFSGCYELSSMTFDKVATIGSSAFSGCTSLTKVVANLLISVGNDAFSGCTKLDTLNVLKVETVGTNAFSGCDNLTAFVSNEITTLGSGAFKNAKLLGNVTLGKVTTLIGDEFTNTSINTFVAPKLTNIPNNMFKNSDYLTALDITSVEVIGDSAFEGCVNLPNNFSFAKIKTIGANAFKGVVTIQTIASEVLTSIGDSAFENCVGLETVNAGMLNTIGSKTFKSCTALTSVSAPNVASIGANAFDNCLFLESISMSKVQSLGDGAFSGCSSLTEFASDEITTLGSGVFRNDILLSSITLGKVTTLTSDEFTNCSSITSFVAPRLTNIPDNMFSDNNSLTTLDISSVEVVGASAFSGCVTIPTNIDFSKVTTIGEYAFKGCTSITSVESEVLTSIGEGAFENCSELVVINASMLDSIGIGVFKGCAKLQNVTLGKVESIDDRTLFNGCNAVVTFTAPVLTSIGSDVLSFKINLTTVDAENLQVVGSSAFASCYKLVTFTSTKLKNIGDSAFKSCRVLEDIHSDSIETIGNNGFDGCAKLKDINTENITILGAEAFKNCTSITAFSSSIITSIGEGVFSGCTKLTSVSIPNVTSLGNMAFKECNVLTSIVTDKIETIGDRALYNTFVLKTIGGVENVANLEKVTAIGEEAFLATGLVGEIVLKSLIRVNSLSLDISGATYIYIPSTNVITYGDTTIVVATGNKLSNQNNIWTDNADLITYMEATATGYYTTSVVITSDTTVVSKDTEFAINIAVSDKVASYVVKYGINVNGTGASLQNISYVGSNEINTNITLDSIGEKVISVVFENKYGDVVEADGSYTVNVLSSDDYKYITVDSNGVITKITYPTTDIVIPEYVDEATEYIKITGIANGVISDTVTSLSLPSSIISLSGVSFEKYASLTSFEALGLVEIEDNLFKDCTALLTVNIPNVTKIGAGAFINCTSLQSVSAGKLVEIFDNAFKGDKKLESVSSNIITTIGNSAFDGCSSLNTIGSVTGVSNLDGVTALGEGAFRNTSALGTVSVNTITEIKADTFYGSGLTSLSATNLLTIEDNAFYNANRLVSITASGITTIGDSALYGASALNTITTDSLSSVGQNALYGASSLKTIGSVSNSVNLSNIVTILDRGFYNNGFTSIYLPSIETIGKEAFYIDNGDVSLKYIALPDNAITLTNDGEESAIENANYFIANISVVLYTKNQDVFTYASNNNYVVQSMTASISVDKSEVVINKTITLTSTSAISSLAGIEYTYEWFCGDKKLDGGLSTIATTEATAGEYVYTLKLSDNMGNTSISNEVRVRYYSNNNFEIFILDDNDILVEFRGNAEYTEVEIPRYIDTAINYREIAGIASSAFANNNIITKIILPNNISILLSGIDTMSGMFSNCTALVSVEFTTTEDIIIGDYAFYGCTSLTSVKAHGDVVSIGNKSFSDAILFTGIVDETSNAVDYSMLTYVGIQAFCRSALVGDIVLDSIETIGYQAFWNIAKQDAIYIDALDKTIEYVLEDGVVVDIKNGVGNIYNNEIYTNNAGIVTFAKANSQRYVVTTLEILTDIDLDYVVGETVDVEIVTTGYGISISWYKDNIKDPNANTEIYTISSDKAGTFVYKVEIVDALGDIYSETFTVKYYINDNYRVFEIDENGVLTKYNGDATEVVVPEYLYEEDLNSKILMIGARAFIRNTNITKVTLPSSVTKICDGVVNEGAFYGCTNLTTVEYLGNITYIGDYAFSTSSKFALFTKDGSTNDFSDVAYIGIKALYSTAISGNVILENIETIGVDAFGRCANVEYLVIGNKNIDLRLEDTTLVDIATAIGSITSKTIYTMNENVVAYAKANALYCETPYVDIGVYQKVVDDGGNEIPEENRVVLKSDIHTIVPDVTNLVSKGLVIGATYQWSVDGVDIPSATNKTYTDSGTVNSIKVYQLEVRDILGNVILSNEINVYTYASVDDYNFTIEDGVLVRYNGTDEEVTVPSEVSNKVITTIGTEAFRGNKTITTVILSEGIVAIESATKETDGAFYGCTNLSMVVSDSLETIGDYAFYRVTSLTTMSVSTITTIGTYAFYGCTSLSRIGSIDGVYNLNNVVIVEPYAFANNTAIGTIFLKNVETMGEQAIRGCERLKVTYIGSKLNNVMYISLLGNKELENITDTLKVIYQASKLSSSEGEEEIPDGIVYVVDNQDLVEYFDRIGFTFYESFEIVSTTHIFRQLVGQDIAVETVATGLNLKYTWYKNDVVVFNTKNITINESVVGTYQYTLKITDELGYTTSKVIEVVYVEFENELTYVVEDGVLVDYLGSSTEIVVPKYVNNVDGDIWISDIGTVFSANTSITKVTLHDGITRLQEGAFRDCTNLVTVVVTSALVEVGHYAFYNNTNFRLFVLDQDSTTSDLSNLTYVGISAFSNTIVREILLKNIEKIGANAFTNVEAGMIYIGNKENIVVVSVAPSVTRSVSYIETPIETSTESITNKALYSSNPDVLAYATLNSIEDFVTLTANITTPKTRLVKDTVFTITSVVTGKDVTYVWYKNGVKIDGETSATLTTSHATVAEVEYYLEVFDSLGSKVESNRITMDFVESENHLDFVVEDGVLISYRGDATEVIVPDSLDSSDPTTNITTISLEAFRGNTNIVSITFGAYVVSIPGVTSDNIKEAPFNGCTNLKYVTFNGFSPISVGAYGFYGLATLETVTFNVESVILAPYAFANCTNLIKVISNKDISIDEYTFYRCISLNTVGVVDNTITILGDTIPAYAFTGCAKIVNIDTTNIVTIKGNALTGITSVKDLKLLKVENIATNAISLGGSKASVVLNKNISAPGADTGLQNNAISGEQVTMYGTIGSYVETYAKNHNITFVPVEITGVVESNVTTISKDYTLSVDGTGYGKLNYTWYKVGALESVGTGKTLQVRRDTVGQDTYYVMLVDEVGNTYTSANIVVVYVDDYYDISYTYGTDGINGEGVTIDVVDTVAYLEAFTLTITIGSEYILESVVINDEPIDIATLENVGKVYTYTIENVDKDYSIVVTTKLVDYIVTIVASENILVQGVTEVPVESNGGFALYFMVNEHYTLDTIMYNDVDITTSEDVVYESEFEWYKVMINNVTRDSIVTITDKLVKHTLAFDISEGGSVDVIAGEYDYGTSIKVTPTASENYVFSKIYDKDGVEATLEDDGSYTFVMDEDITIRVEFKLVEKTVTASIIGGTLDRDSIIVEYGSSVTITFSSEASDVYSIMVDGVYVDDLSVLERDGNNYSYTISSIVKDTVIEIVMGVNVTISSGVGYTIDPVEEIVFVEYGASYEAVITADDGYILSSVLLNNVEQLNSGSVYTYTITLQDIVEEQDLIVAVNAMYDVSASITNGEIITPVGSETLESGTNTVVEFTVDENYILDSIMVNGESISLIDNTDLVYEDGIYTLSVNNITENTVVVIHATLKKVSLSINAGANGIVSVNDVEYNNEIGNINIDYDTGVDVAITPNAEYLIDTITFNGDNVDIASAFTLSHITNDTNTLVVTFKIKQYEVKATAGDISVEIVSPVSTINVDSGASATIKYKIAPNYHLNYIKVNGVNYTGEIDTDEDGNYLIIITSITKKTVVEVYSAIDTFTVSVNALANGTVSVSQVNNVRYGDTQKLVFTPSANYVLLRENISLQIDTGSAIEWTYEANELVISNIDSNVVVTATFTLLNEYYSIEFESDRGVSTNAFVDTVKKGDSYTFEFRLNEHYLLDTILKNDTDFTDYVIREGVYTFTIENISENITINVTSKLEEFNLNLNIATGGQVQVETADGVLEIVDSKVSIPYGSRVSITISTETGYHIDTVMFKGDTVLVNGKVYVIDSMTEESTFAVTFKASKDTYTLSTTLSTGAEFGAGSSDTMVISAENNATVSFTVAEHYHIASITLNGITLDTDVEQNVYLSYVSGVYTFEILEMTSDYDLVIAVAKDKVKVNVTIKGDGIITPDFTMTNTTGGVYEVDYDTGLEMVFTSKSGYYLSKVTLDAVDQSVNTGLDETIKTYTLSLENIVDTHAIVVEFAPETNNFVVNVTISRGGEITLGGGRNIVTKNDSHTVNFTVDTVNHYELKHLYINGTDISLIEDPNIVLNDLGAGSYTLTISSVIEAKNISIMCGLVSYPIIFNYNDEFGSIYASQKIDNGGSHEISYNANAVIQVVPVSGYELLATNIVTEISSTDISSMYYTYESGYITIYNVDRASSMTLIFTKVEVNYEARIIADTSVEVVGELERVYGEDSYTDISFTIDENYELSNILVNSIELVITSENLTLDSGVYTLKIKMTENVIININSKLVSRNINIVNDTNGTVYVSDVAYSDATGVAQVQHGQNAVITVVPALGYEILSMTLDGGEIVATDKTTHSFTISSVEKDYTIEVTFKLVAEYHAVTVASGSGGIVSNIGRNNVLKGETFSISITPNENYRLLSLTFDGESVDILDIPYIDGVYTYNTPAIEKDVTINAMFTLVEHIITFNISSNGTISINNESFENASEDHTISVVHGSNLEFIFTADAGYKLSTVTIDDEPVIVSGSTYTYTNVVEAHTIYVTFEKLSYTVNITSGENGRVNVDSIDVYYGENVEFEITADTGYLVADILVGGSSVDKDTIADAYIEAEGKYVYAITNITNNINVEVIFSLKTLNITIVTNGNGAVDLDNIIVNYGTNKTISIYPARNNHIVAITDNTIDVFDSLVVENMTTYTYTISDIVEDHNIIIDFALDKITVNTIVTGDSQAVEVNPIGESRIDYGTNHVIDIEVNAGYILQGIYVDGVLDTSYADKEAGVYQYTLSSVVATCEINIVMVKDTYSITANAGVSFADGVNTVGYKQDKVVYIAVEDGYDLNTFTVDGEVIDANDIIYNTTNSRYEYTISQVTKDIEVSAEITRAHNIAISIVGNESNVTVTPKNGKATVATGGDKVYKITLATDNHLYSIKVNEVDYNLRELVRVNDDYYMTIENVSEDIDIVVTISTGSYMITVTYGENGKTLPDTDIGISYPGESVTIVLYPNANYRVDYIIIDEATTNTKINAVDLPTNEAGFKYYTFENVIDNHSIHAVFTLKEYSVTINYHGVNGGQMTGSTYTITNVDSVDYSVVVNTGYILTHIEKNGVVLDDFNDKVSDTYTYTLSGVTEDVVFDLYYTTSTFDITIESFDASMGSISYDNLVVDYKGSKTFVITANTGYILKDLLLDGDSVYADMVDNTYVLENVTADHDIEVVFVVGKTITTSISNEMGGYIDRGIGDYLVEDGTDTVVGIFTNYGYMLLDILVDGVSVGDISQYFDEVTEGYYYDFVQVSENHTIEAIIVKTHYIVSISKNGGGNVSPYSINGVSVAYGQSLNINITPYSNYIIKSFKVNDVEEVESLINISGIYSYTISSVVEDCVVVVEFATATNIVSFVINGNGSVSPIDTGNTYTIPFNGSQAFTFTPDEDYIIAGVKIDGEVISSSVGSAGFNYRLSRVQEGHIIEVDFVEATYEVVVSVNDGTMGEVSNEGPNTIDFMDNFIINISAGTGYMIHSITVDGDIYDLDQLVEIGAGIYSLTIDSVVSDMTIEVAFIESYTISVILNNKAYGYIEGDLVVSKNSTSVYNIFANPKYMVSTIKIDGSSIDIASIYNVIEDCYVYTFIDIVDNHTIEVEYIDAEYKVNIVTNEGGIVSKTGVVVVEYNTSYTLTMTPQEHYHLAKVILNGADVLDTLEYNDGTYTLTIDSVIRNHNIRVEFELDTVNISVKVNNTYGGYVVPSTLVTLRYGQDQNYEINVYEDYVLVSVLIDGRTYIDINTIKVTKRLYVYEFANVTEDRSIEVTFASAKYYVENTSSIGGTISNSQYVNYGESYKCYFTPNAHYEIASVQVNNADIELGTLQSDDGGTYLLLNSVTVDYSIKVTYKLQEFTINVVIVNNSYGEVNYASNTVEYGGSMTFTMMAYTNYLIASVKVDGVTQTNLNTYVFTDVVEDHTIEVTFAKKEYSVNTILTSAVEAGSVVSPTKVNYGGSITLEFRPSANYKLASLVINGRDVENIDSIGSTYVIENVSEDHTIMVEYVFTHYDISIENTTGGNIIGDATSEYGADKTYRIELFEGYYLDKLYVNDIVVNPMYSEYDGCYYYTIESIEDNYTIRATYLKYTFDITFVIDKTALGLMLPAPAGDVATVQYGADYTTYITAKTGYRISKVLVNGDEYAMEGDNLVLYNITDDITVEILIIPHQKYNISLYEGVPNAIVTFATESYVGDKVEFTVTPKDGYKIDKVEVLDSNGIKVALEAGDRSFTMPQSNVFIKITVSGISTGGEGGGDTPDVPTPPETPPSGGDTPDVPIPPEKENGGLNIVLVIILAVIGIAGAGTAVTVIVIHVVKSKRDNVYRSRK